MVTLARTSSGLLYQSDGSLSGWTGGGQWTSAAAVRLVASPAIPMRPGAIPISQMFGEPKLTIHGGEWFLLYDDAVLPGRLSRSALQVSSDRGITWVDVGPFTFSSPQTQSGITLAGPYLDPNDGFWYQGAFSANNGIVDQGGIFGPGTYLIFKSANIQGPYTQVNTIADVSGSWSANGQGPGGQIWDGTHYNLFAGGNPASGVSSSAIVAGLYQSTTWTGTFTQPNPTTPVYDGPVDGPALSALSQNGIEGENVCFNPALNLYIMMGAATVAGGYDYSVVLQTSATLTFPTSGWKHTQWLCPADFNLLVSVGSIVTNGPNAQAATGPNGEMTILSADQRPNWTDVGSPFPHYTGLACKFATLEPASAVIRYTGLDATYRQLTRALSHTDITAECGCELTGVSGGSGEFHFVYRSDGTGNNEYRAVLQTNSTWRLDKIVGGTRSLLMNGSGSQAFGNEGASLGMLHRLKVQCVGNIHTAWLDGELQYTYTDSSTPFTSGTHIAIAGVNVSCDVINLSSRTSDMITVTGMQPDTSCWLRAACGIPVAPIVANSSGVGTISCGHFPLFSLDIAGTDYTVGTDSRIWGGDTLQFSGLPSSPPGLPNPVYFA